MYRLVIWLVASLAAVLAVSCLDVPFSAALLDHLFGSKLAYLGIIVAAGIFQYRLVFDLVQDSRQAMRDDPSSAEAIRMRWRNRIIPHMEGVLWSLMSVGLALFLSCLADIGRMLSPVGVPSLRRMSTAFFVVSFLPMMEVGYRYVRTLRQLFDWLQELFAPR